MAVRVHRVFDSVACGGRLMQSLHEWGAALLEDGGSVVSPSPASSALEVVRRCGGSAASSGLEKCLLPLRLKDAAGTSNGCFDSYWKYKSTPNPFYADAERCLRVALHSSPPVMAAFLPLIQILLLGDKLKDALCELEKICGTSTAALPFRLRGRLVEYYDQNQVPTISCCYEESLRRDPSCSYSVERLTEMHRKGFG